MASGSGSGSRVGETEGDAEADGDAETDGEAETDGDVDGDGETVGEADADGDADGVGDGEEATPPTGPVNRSIENEPPVPEKRWTSIVYVPATVGM